MIAKQIITLSMVMAFGWVVVNAQPAPGAVPPNGPAIAGQAATPAPVDPSKKFHIPEAAKPGHVAPDRIGIPERPRSPVPPVIGPRYPAPIPPYIGPGPAPIPAPWTPFPPPAVRPFPAPSPWGPRPAPIPPYWGPGPFAPWGPPPPAYWGPPVPDVRSRYWFWFIWSPLPLSYYDSAPIQNNYYYYDTEKPSDSQENYQSYDDQNSEKFDAKKYQKQYENWLVKELKLGNKQKGKFVSQLRTLQKIRENYMAKRATLSQNLNELQSRNVPEYTLQQKMTEIENMDRQFRVNEQQAIDRMLSTLTVEQRAKYYGLQSQYNQNK